MTKSFVLSKGMEEQIIANKIEWHTNPIDMPSDGENVVCAIPTNLGTTRVLRFAYFKSNPYLPNVYYTGPGFYNREYYIIVNCFTRYYGEILKWCTEKEFNNHKGAN